MNDFMEAINDFIEGILGWIAAAFFGVLILLAIPHVTYVLGTLYTMVIAQWAALRFKTLPRWEREEAEAQAKLVEERQREIQEKALAAELAAELARENARARKLEVRAAEEKRKREKIEVNRARRLENKRKRRAKLKLEREEELAQKQSQ